MLKHSIYVAAGNAGEALNLVENVLEGHGSFADFNVEAVSLG